MDGDTGDTFDDAWLEEEDMAEQEASVEELDNVNEAIQGEDNQSNEIVVPKVGMLFPDPEAMFKFWTDYGNQTGFPVRKRSSKRKKGKNGEEGEVAFVWYTCSLAGKNKSSSTLLRLPPTTQKGCPVLLTGGLRSNGQWCINTLRLQHNHSVSPSKSRFFRVNRSISKRAKRRLELNDNVGIRPCENISACIEEMGGYENAGFTPTDARNHIERSRHLRLGEGDAVAIQQYFLKMQSRSPNFFFSMDLDEKEGRLQNLFWADARSREAYKEFGTVVTFDTTYLVNRYDMPFAPFVGVNHHGQSVLLGCGLISSEDTETFCWLFQTWLTCMDNCAPEAIITDQDRAMQNAIQIIFPNARHRWCLWHITKKIPEKLGSYKASASIIYHFFNAIYDSQKPTEFEQSWNDMVEMYSLQDNSWLSGLYNERHRWIPCFVKDRFWAGMSTTQRSEGVNAFFYKYVNSKTSLKQFVEQYGNALREKVEKENDADYRSLTGTIRLATIFVMEKQFQDVYTIAKFKEFQIELLSKMYCIIVSKKEVDASLEWEVQEDIIVGEGIPKTVKFTVSLTYDDCDIKCSCRLFEFRGILCRHAINVFHVAYGNVKLPGKYIFNLWRKDVKRCHSRVNVTYDGWVATDAEKRYDEMSVYFNSKIADLASEDANKTHQVLEFLRELTEHMAETRLTPPSEAHGQPSSRLSEEQVPLDPIRKQGKVRPREKRLKSMFEKIADRLSSKNKEKSAISKDLTIQPKKNSRVQKSCNRNKVPKENEIHVSQVHEQTPTQHEPTQESMPMDASCTQESMALSVSSTQERFSHGRNMNFSLGVTPPGYFPNPFWHYGYTPSGGFDANIQQQSQQFMQPFHARGPPGNRFS